ncbi:tripartite tricarboxylate transporter substrate binding protein [Hydrogenophaga sp. D2P1]|uniref:Tripartite tricarboxylate transporter substrate binding protein n=2 Tax=Hydrogenophaga aromaticivorans TaxID=2610898 RepID=A0A7Y8GV81_9BURK|nr:tripartite tricarboxylate transporter substrate binding protein [Hydrogenophaga aromaticivorans]
MNLQLKERTRTMTLSISRRHATALLLALPATRLTFAQENWPSRPIKLVVPYPPGGNSDNLGRIVAERVAAQLNATIIVDNKPGGTTQIGTELVARAAPDGYTLLLGAITAFTVLPHLRKKLPFDPKRSFEPLGAIADYVAVAAARKDLGVATLTDLVRVAKANPGKLTYGSAGLSSFGHIAGEIIKRDAGIDMLHVPFKGSADAAAALTGGQIDFLIDGTTVQLAKGARAVALFAFSDKRHPELPNVPSLPETGLQVKRPTGASWGLFAPAGTPKAIADKLAKALERALAEPDTQARMQRISALPAWGSPAELMRGVDNDFRFYGELLPAIGLNAED